MLGKYFSFGNLYNKGEINLNKEYFFKLKIEDAVLIKMDLINNKVFGKLIDMAKEYFINLYLPFLNTPKIAHYALLLNTNSDNVIIIEYGQYLNINSEKKSTGIFGSCSNSKCRETEDNNIYYYLLNDGARFYEIKKNKCEDWDKTIGIIACNYYGITLDQFMRFTDHINFQTFDLCVNNKITLGELVNSFVNEVNWNAKDYNLFHNCQHFVAKCINILKLTRNRAHNKKRVEEILYFPPCILKAFYDSEGWDRENTFKRIMQRIPIIGSFI